MAETWTEEKLDCVRKYLNAYRTIMQLTSYSYTYIDAFAGMGYRQLRNQEDSEIRRFIVGSAQRALEVKQPFPKYIFIEANKQSFAELKKLKDEFPEHNIEFINRDANSTVKNFCIKTDWRTNRALAFLDPYGMNVEWSTNELIAQTQAIDPTFRTCFNVFL